MNLPFVIPGHYVSLDTINSEEKRIIRVLCEGTKKDHFKVLNEKREFSESEILNGFQYMSTNNSEFTPNIPLGNLKNIEDTEETNQYQEEVYQQPKVYEPKQYSNEPEKLESTYIPPVLQVPQKSENEIFVDNLLEKIKNEKQEIISIPINFNFKYDIEKLKDLIKIMDIDKPTTKLIISKLIDNSLKENVFSAIELTINNLINNNITLEKEKNIIQNNVVIENKIESNENLTKNESNENLTKIDKNNLYGETTLLKKFNIDLKKII